MTSSGIKLATFRLVAQCPYANRILDVKYVTETFIVAVCLQLVRLDMRAGIHVKRPAGSSTGM
jgi:hypothetical protein